MFNYISYLNFYDLEKKDLKFNILIFGIINLIK